MNSANDQRPLLPAIIDPRKYLNAKSEYDTKVAQAWGA
jgi:hypothetical protein